MPNILMAEVGLDAPGILASVRQRVARGVAQHVGMRLERQSGLFAGALDHPIEAVAIERGATLIDEDEGGLRVLLFLQSPKGSKLCGTDLMRGCRAAFLARDV